MRRFWKAASGFLLAFLIFAPPGTMIFIGLFLAWLLGDTWWGILIILIGAAAGAAVILKLRNQRRETENKS